MKLPRKPLFAILCFSLLAFSATAAKPGLTHVFHYENVLGTSLAIKVVSASPVAAERAEGAALAEIERDSQILSTYDPQSEVSRWLGSTNTPKVVSPELYSVLGLFDDWRGRTNGALDASAGVVSQLWKASARENRVPTEAELASAISSIRQSHWKLDPVAHTATHLSAAPLSLNSFVKSYIINRATDAALATGDVDAVVVNIGGDLVVRGNLTEPVDIADPLSDAENSAAVSRLMVRDRAVATSGNYRRGLRIGDKWYSHIVDPRTAQPVDHVISSTVVAPAATDAGALATAFSVMSPEESLALAATLPGVEALLLTRDGRRVTTPGWSALEAPVKKATATPRATTSTVAGAIPQNWDGSYELSISFDLAQIADRGYRRPYVAVWIEDKDHFPVRTLALWYEKPRWLPDLKVWSHGDRIRSLSEGTDISRSVSSATRPAGKYSLKWDGIDNQGKPVKAGRYTVLIEAAREHGTYQLMRQDIDLRSKPQQFTLPGNTEIAGASIDYRKK